MAMAQSKGITFISTHKFLNTLFSEDVHAKRIYSLANATLGVISSASLAVNTIGQGLALARGRLEDYDILGVDGLDLHHFYRAMAWLGEEMEEKPEGALEPRCVKDVIEEKLFDRRRDLFTDLSAVFMDTTSLSFYGEGGETLGEHGYSKDYRPDLKQMILGLVVDGSGSPICTEMWPGNTADVTTLLPVIDRLRERFSIGRVCVVADRGMISAETIAGLEERKLEYILGARERSNVLVKRIVMENDAPFVPLVVTV